MQVRRVLGWAMAVLLAAGGAAHAGGWRYGGDAPALVLGSDPEDLAFHAACHAGEVRITYFAPDRDEIDSGIPRACEALRPCREDLPVTVLIDGKPMALQGRAVPEEMNGGYEVEILVAVDAPLWAAMARGRTLALRIDGKVGEKLSLKGIPAPLGKLLAACAGGYVPPVGAADDALKG